MAEPVSRRTVIKTAAQSAVARSALAGGFAHAVAVVMATRSYREGKKPYWDRKNEAIVEQPPA